MPIVELCCEIKYSEIFVRVNKIFDLYIHNHICNIMDYVKILSSVHWNKAF